MATTRRNPYYYSNWSYVTWYYPRAYYTPGWYGYSAGCCSGCASPYYYSAPYYMYAPVYTSAYYAAPRLRRIVRLLAGQRQLDDAGCPPVRGGWWGRNRRNFRATWGTKVPRSGCVWWSCPGLARRIGETVDQPLIMRHPALVKGVPVERRIIQTGVAIRLERLFFSEVIYRVYVAHRRTHQGRRLQSD